MSDELKEINERLTRMETNQEKMGQDIQKLGQEQQQIKQAVLETNEVVKRMEKFQIKQHQIIELLSSRSIEQEAEIKRIK